MKKKGKSGRGLDAEAQSLWQSVTAHVKPLTKKEKQPSVPELKSASHPLRPASETRPACDAGAKPRVLPKGGKGFDIDRRTHDRVKRGERKIEARLDLHGLRQEEAHDRLIVFIRKSYAAQKRMLLIITGKGERGQGVLRASLPR